MIKLNRLYFTIICSLLLLPWLVLGECNCEPDRNIPPKSLALKYKLAAIASILAAGAIGVCLPTVARFIPALHPESDIFFLIKSLAAGVILSTGFVHILPDAFNNLTSPCLNGNPWGEFPFTGFVAMVAAIGTLMVDSLATSYYSRRNRKFSSVSADDGNFGDGEGEVHVQAHATHSHPHGVVMADDSAASDLLRHRVISQVLELSIVVHSIIIGISLGTSKSPKIIRSQLAALTFHQFFEGIGLGGCIFQAKFKRMGVAIMSMLFSLTTPIGIGIGIAISNSYDERSPKALIVEGVFNAASAGILIYMALVDLLAADFMSPKLQTNGKLQFGVNFCLLFGAACMSLLAKWT